MVIKHFSRIIAAVIKKSIFKGVMGGIHLEINVRTVCHDVVMLQKKFHWILIGYLISMIILTVSMDRP